VNHHTHPEAGPDLSRVNRDTPGTVRDIYVRAVGTALPGPALSNEVLARRFGMTGHWEPVVQAFIGTQSRHLAIDLETGQPYCSLADLCRMAASRALDTAGLTAADVDLMVLGTATPDMLMPATVNVVADQLGINNVATYQLQSGCTGAVQALNAAYQMMLTCAYRTALVLGGETATKYYDLSLDFARLPPTQMINYVLFGDGAGAMVLTPGPGPAAAVIRKVVTRLEGMNRPPGQTLDWFGPADRDSDRPPAIEDYKAIEESVPIMASELLAELLDNLGWKDSEVGCVLPPQLSGQMTKRIMAGLKLPDAREISCVRETGNIGNAMPFFQLERVLPEMRPGDRAICLSVESSKWIKGGFALQKV